jgi:hypothetical protein
MNYYVKIKSPESLFSVAYQNSSPTGKTRLRKDGKIEAEFIPLDKGYYQGKFWATKDEII